MSNGRFDRVKDEYRSRSRSRSPFRKNFNERSTYEDDYKKRRRDRSPRRSSSSSAKNRVFVNNIPFECRWMEIKDLFREKVGDVSFVELFEDDTGKFKGCGIVELKDAETALKAVEVMHKYEVRGRPLNVKIDSEEYDRKRPSGRTGDRDMMRGNDFRDDMRTPQFNTYGLNPDFLRSLGITGSLNNKVFISNLDYKVTEKKLEEIFKIAGKLNKVELNVDNEGKSKGHGTAEFENPLEAVQAISMFNGQRLYARIMNVRMDKFAEDGDSLPSKLPSGLHGIGKGLGMSGQPMQFNKNSNPIGSFGFGMGMPGNAGGGMSSGGIGVGSSNMGMMPSSGMGLGSVSMGMNNSMAADRMMGTSALGMGMSGSGIGGGSSSLVGMGGSSTMMSNNSMVARSSLDGVGRDSSFSMSSGSRSFRDGFDRGSDSFSTSNVTDTILLGNLPSSFSWQTLKDRFREIGDVRYAELKGQGNAIVRFSNMTDAQRAVDLMNGYRMDGRAIQVRFY